MNRLWNVHTCIKFEHTRDQRSTEAQDGLILARWWMFGPSPSRPEFSEMYLALVRVGPEFMKMFGWKYNTVSQILPVLD